MAPPEGRRRASGAWRHPCPSPRLSRSLPSRHKARRERERSLYRPVLPVRPVQDGKYDIDTRGRCISCVTAIASTKRPCPPGTSQLAAPRRGSRASRTCSGAIAGIASEPAAIPGDADEGDVIAIGVERAQDIGSRCQETSCSAERPPNSSPIVILRCSSAMFSTVEPCELWDQPLIPPPDTQLYSTFMWLADV